jgi:hypothetical protein
MVPDFLKWTFLSRGFQFAKGPPAVVAEPRGLDSSDPWIVIGAVLHRLARGDLGAVAKLPGILKSSDDGLIRNACIQMLGFAGPTALIQETVAHFVRRPGDPDDLWDIAVLALNACGLWAVGPLLAMHAAAGREDARRHVERCISILLEPSDAGPLFDGAEVRLVHDPAYPEEVESWVEVPNVAGYARRVRDQAAAVARGLGSPGVAVAEGAALNLHAIARELHAGLMLGEANSHRMEWERMLLEASTGIDFSAFYDGKIEPQRLAATAIVEDALDLLDEGKFRIGQRYFFGHPIPD